MASTEKKVSNVNQVCKQILHWRTLKAMPEKKDQITWVEEHIKGKDGKPVSRDNGAVYLYNAENKIKDGRYPPKEKEKKSDAKPADKKDAKDKAAAAKEKNLAKMKEVSAKIKGSKHTAEPPAESAPADAPATDPAPNPDVTTVLGGAADNQAQA